jgi:hypothetical protein
MKVHGDTANQDVLDPFPFKGTKQFHEPGEFHCP